MKPPTNNSNSNNSKASDPSYHSRHTVPSQLSVGALASTMTVPLSL